MTSEFNNTDVVVVSGGAAIHPLAARVITADTVIVAADSGWDRARELGVVPHVLVGDMDSIAPDSLSEAERSGAVIVRHSADKDSTDIELALAHAATLSRRITVLSGGGGRLDQAIAELAALTSPVLDSCSVDAIIGTSRVHAVSPRTARTIDAEPGTTLSLLVVGETATGVNLSGCKWGLTNAELGPHESRGVSNVVVAPPVTVSVTNGHVLVIEPFHLASSSLHESADR